VLWLVFISAWVPEEAVLGVFAAALAATAAEAVRERLAGFRVRARWLWPALRLPWRAMRETRIVLGILARRVIRGTPVRGRFRVVPVDLPEDPHEQAAKRALITAGESFAPNAYVLTIDNRLGLILIHELVEGE
jgi:hypothetical protein